MPRGFSPLRMTVNPATRTAYVIFKNQLAVAVFKIDEASGLLTLMQEVDTVPKQFEIFGEMKSTEIVLHPNRRWLYVATMGAIGVIVAYEINEISGVLKQIQIKKMVGNTPRHFSFGLGLLDWTLMVAQEQEGILEVYTVNHQTGQLSELQQKIASSNSPTFVTVL